MYVYVKCGRYDETEKNTTYVASNSNSLITPCFIQNDTKKTRRFSLKLWKTLLPNS